MKTPSRRMPQYQITPLHPAKRLIMSVLVTASVLLGVIYLAYLGPIKLILVASIGIAICLYTRHEFRQTRQHLNALAVSRHNESLCEFARSFDCRTIDTWVIRAVYEEVQEELQGYFPDFPIRADDHLEKDLHIDPDDLDLALAPAISARTGRVLQRTEDNPYWSKVRSVADLVMFFNAQAHLSSQP